MQIIDGRKVSKEMKEEIKSDIEELKEKGITPGLTSIIVGDDPASKAYVNSNDKAFKKLGMKSVIHNLEEDVSEEELLSLIEDINNDDSLHGILIQMPLPNHISEKKVIEKISPEKDVDGFHPLNAGKLLIGEDGFIPCTPYGVIKLLERENIEIEGKNAVVLGRSNIVGKPISLLLLEKNATVTICHSRTKNLKEIAKEADIIIAAIGKANFVTRDMVKEGATVVDVGINSVDGDLVGDVDFEAVKEVAGLITPVPGGVGPMTVTMLMNNTIKAARKMLKN